MDLLDACRIIIVSTFLTTEFLHLAIGKNMFSIIREPRDSSAWAVDYFKPSSLKCSGSNVPPDCTAYRGFGVVGDDCQCQCPYQKATFGFYSRVWTCLNNTEVRSLTGCKYKFKSEYADYYPLKIVKQNQEYNIILPSEGCSVESETTRYFTCDGRWAGIDSQSWFTISYNKPIRHKYQGHAQLMIEPDVDDYLLGKIISLDITCAKQDRSCLLFKLDGTLLCPENVTTIVTSPSSSIPFPTTKASVITPTTAATTTTLTKSTSNAGANTNETVKKDQVKEGGGSWTVVGVVVTLVIIVAIVMGIAAFVYCKRKRKSRPTQPKKKTVDETQEDPEYAEIPEEQRRNEPVDQPGGTYSYVFEDPQTAYTAPQPAPYNRLLHNRQEADKEGAIYSTVDDGPVYNVLERPPAENQTMMISESILNEEPPSQDLEPEYHVLEEPPAVNQIMMTSESTLNDGNADVRA